MNIDMLVGSVLALWLATHMGWFVWWFAARDWVRAWRQRRAVAQPGVARSVPLW